MKLEPLYLIAGLPGSGKSTFLKHLLAHLVESRINPYVVLNDYVGADFDALEVAHAIGKENTLYLPGNCVCCDGLIQLREALIQRPQGNNPLSIIEANGTSDPVELLSHLAVIEHGLSQPVVITTINARDWQDQTISKAMNMELIQCASAVYLTHLDVIDARGVLALTSEIQAVLGCSIPLYKSLGEIVKAFLNSLKPKIDPVQWSQSDPVRHEKYHFSCGHIKLPKKMRLETLHQFLKSLPRDLIRVKGVVSLQESETKYHYFERLQDGSITVKRFNPKPRFGTSMIVVGRKVNSKAIEKNLYHILENI